MVGFASSLGANLLLLVAVLFAVWISWKFLQKRRFLRQLAVARITPTELQKRLAAGEELFIVDLRSGVTQEAVLIPGAVGFGSNPAFFRILLAEVPQIAPWLSSG